MKIFANCRSIGAIGYAKFILCGILVFATTAQAEDYSHFQSPIGFKLESATLSDVQERFGSAEEFEIPDSHHQFGICYFTGDSVEIVVFSTGREFGGPTKLLLGVTLHTTNVNSFPCSESTLQSAVLDIGGLNLSLSPSDFESLAAGEPDQLEGGYVDFDLAYRRKLTDEERNRFVERSIDPDRVGGPDVGLGVWARFVEGSAIEVGVWQITTF